jgi:hypothetical protein
MTGRRRDKLRAEWIDRFRRFQNRFGNVEEFCRAESASLAMLHCWLQQLAGAVPGRVPGPRPKVPARVTRRADLLADVRIRLVPVTEFALRIVLPNGIRLQVPCVNVHPKTGHAGHPTI